MGSAREEMSLNIENKESVATPEQAPTVVPLSENAHAFFKFDKRLVKPTVIESTVALTSAFITTPFIEEDISWYTHPLSLTSAMIIFNFICRAYQFDSNEANCEALKKLKSILLSLTFAGVDNFIRTQLVHESGHLIAYLCFYENVKLKLRMGTLKGSGTLHDFYGENHTAVFNTLGAMLGENKTTAVISAAGPATELFFDYMMFIAAETISDNYPQLKWNLRLTALYSVLSTIVYVSLGISSSCSEPNDFCSLNEHANISLNESMGFIIGCTVLLQALLQLCLYCCNRIRRQAPIPSSHLFSPAPEIAPAIEMKEVAEDKIQLLMKSPMA